MTERTYENYYKAKSAEIHRTWVAGMMELRATGVQHTDDEGVSSLEKKVRAYQDRFVAGDDAARHIVWALVWKVMVARASRGGMDYEEAANVATDAMMYVQDYVTRVPEKVDSLMALFNRSLWMHVQRVKDGRGHLPEIMEANLDLPGEDPYSGDEEEIEEPLVQLEAAMMGNGYVPHAYLTSVTLATPESDVVSENLREFLERVAVEACGQEAWSIYHAVVVQEKTQAEIAETHDMDQSTVSRKVRDVGLALREALVKGA